MALRSRAEAIAFSAPEKAFALAISILGEARVTSADAPKTTARR